MNSLPDPLAVIDYFQKHIIPEHFEHLNREARIKLHDFEKILAEGKLNKISDVEYNEYLTEISHAMPLSWQKFGSYFEKFHAELDIARMNLAKKSLNNALNELGCQCDMTWKKTNASGSWEQSILSIWDLKIKVAVSAGGVVSINGNPFCPPPDQKPNISPANIIQSILSEIPQFSQNPLQQLYRQIFINKVLVSEAKILKDCKNLEIDEVDKILQHGGIGKILGDRTLRLDFETILDKVMLSRINIMRKELVSNGWAQCPSPFNFQKNDTEQKMMLFIQPYTISKDNHSILDFKISIADNTNPQMSVIKIIDNDASLNAKELVEKIFFKVKEYALDSLVVHSGQYLGEILSIDKLFNVAIQDTGRGVLAHHKMDNLLSPVEIGQKVDISYVNRKGRVTLETVKQVEI